MSDAAAAPVAAASTGTPDNAGAAVAAGAAKETQSTPPANSAHTGQAAQAAKPEATAPDGKAQPFLGDPKSPESEKVTEGKDKSEPAKAEEKKPEPAKFELKLADDLKASADPKLLEEYSAIATEAVAKGEVSPAFAQKLAEWNIQKHQAAVKADLESWQRRGEVWSKELESDPEFGGKNLAESREAVTRAWTQFSTPEERKVVQELGLENFPPFVKLFRRIGLATKEDSSATPKVGTPPAPKGPGRLEYPSMDQSGKPVPNYHA